MGFFTKEVVVLKETSGAKDYLRQLEDLLPNTSGELRSRIERDIAMTKAGIAGEENILYELKNSGMDMYVLQDIMVTDGNMSAQIDFFVVTAKMNFIIECKNLYGNIEINSKGDFIRSFNYKGRWIKEGLYSPITQNARHLQILKNIQVNEASSGISRLAKQTFFDHWNRSLVVLANPKTVVNDRYARYDIKNQVIRADQLISVIRRICSESHEIASSGKEMESIARKMLERNMAERKDYAEKYRELLAESSTVAAKAVVLPVKEPVKEVVKEENKPNSYRGDDSAFIKKAEIPSSSAEKMDKVEEELAAMKAALKKQNSNKEEQDGQAKQVEQKEKTESSQKSEKAVRNCPRCGAPLVLRTAKKGNNAGNQFWGCSSFPKCRFISNL